jgi:hypothetical protein
VDRTPLREGRVVRMWMASLGGVALYEADLPSCCRRAARHAVEGDTFECPSCGAVWQVPEPVEPEACAFMERGDGERKGAA